MTVPPGSKCYAVRRVNPFVGALHVLETPLGRAQTVNGVVWELELLTTVASREWGSLNKNSTRTIYSRYGLWSEAAPGLPVALRDNRELWLLDQH